MNLKVCFQAFFFLLALVETGKAKKKEDIVNTQKQNSLQNDAYDKDTNETHGIYYRATGEDVSINFNTSCPRWYQTYKVKGDNEDIISDISTIYASEYNLNVEIFDYNSFVICERKIMDIILKISNITLKKKIQSIPGNEKSTSYNFTTKLRYSDTENTQFNCPPYPGKFDYTLMGLVNTTSNVIKTFNKTNLTKKFKMADNGSMLCCLYYSFHIIKYVSTGDANNTPHRIYGIKRHVRNKKILIYDGLEPTTNIIGYTTTYILVSVAMVIVLLVISIMVIKYRRKKSNSPEALELETYATPNRVLYAELELIRQQGNYVPPRQEQSDYAKIIGYLKPKSTV